MKKPIIFRRTRGRGTDVYTHQPPQGHPNTIFLHVSGKASSTSVDDVFITWFAQAAPQSHTRCGRTIFWNSGYCGACQNLTCTLGDNGLSKPTVKYPDLVLLLSVPRTLTWAILQSSRRPRISVREYCGSWTVVV